MHCAVTPNAMLAGREIGASEEEEETRA